MILHGGDLADAGAGPAEIVDRIRDLGWQGVIGNTDQTLTTPDSLSALAEHSPQPQALFAVFAEMTTATREALGEDRLVWLRSLPRAQTRAPMALVRASPESAWRAPTPESSNVELESVYRPLGQPVAIYSGSFQMP